nr:Uncharacterised protein [Raoultella sp. NCTC 9187]
MNRTLKPPGKTHYFKEIKTLPVALNEAIAPRNAGILSASLIIANVMILTRQKYMLEYFSCALKVQRKGKIND